MKAHGKVHKYGDNVDTDVIIPARHLNTSDHKELASHCMEDIDTEFVKKVKQGDIMVGGENFGCGSSREHAPIAIKASGIVLLQRPLPGSSTEMLLISDCRSSNVRKPARRSRTAMRFPLILTAE